MLIEKSQARSKRRQPPSNKSLSPLLVSLIMGNDAKASVKLEAQIMWGIEFSAPAMAANPRNSSCPTKIQAAKLQCPNSISSISMIIIALLFPLFDYMDVLLCWHCIAT